MNFCGFPADCALIVLLFCSGDLEHNVGAATLCKCLSCCAVSVNLVLCKSSCTQVKFNASKVSCGPVPCGPSSVWAQFCVGPVLCGPSSTRAQFRAGPVQVGPVPVGPVLAGPVLVSPNNVFIWDLEGKMM